MLDFVFHFLYSMCCLFCNKIYKIYRLILPVVRLKVNRASRIEGDATISKQVVRLSGRWIVECLDIIDVGYNLKQFDCLT